MSKAVDMHACRADSNTEVSLPLFTPFLRARGQEATPPILLYWLQALFCLCLAVGATPLPVNPHDIVGSLTDHLLLYGTIWKGNPSSHTSFHFDQATPTEGCKVWICQTYLFLCPGMPVSILLRGFLLYKWVEHGNMEPVPDPDLFRTGGRTDPQT